jgi:hypothetical protein
MSNKKNGETSKELTRLQITINLTSIGGVIQENQASINLQIARNLFEHGAALGVPDA